MSQRELKLSVWADGVAPSPTLAVTARVKALKAAGEDICGFGAGEPDFDTPEFIKAACAEALGAGQTKYAPAPGIPALRAALAEKHVAVNGIAGVEASQVVVSPGGKYSCYLAMLATCGPGDEVIIAAPYWVSYPEMAKLTGASPVVIEAGEAAGFKVSPEQLEAAVTERSRMFVLNSPSNPTGAVYSREELEAVVEVALKHGLYVLSDEIYEYLLYDGVEHHSPASFGAEAADRVITVGGFSKTFSMTGWRLGTLVAAPPVAKAVASLQSQTTSNATTFAQYGALAAIERPDEAKAAVAEMLVAFDRRRLSMLEALRAMPGLTCNRAQGAFYLFPSIAGTGLDSDAFTARLLEEEKVAVVPGSAFGAPDCVRLSYATSDDVIAEGMARLGRFCAGLAG